jgi:hypothetical protein
LNRSSSVIRRNSHFTIMSVVSGTIAALLLLQLFGFTSIARADTITDLYGTQIDKADFYNEGMPESLSSTLFVRSSLFLSKQSSSISPMTLSPEMLYFGKYESGQNYNKGLSYGDEYHAMGYFQFDNRYGLGDFLKNVYYYNTSTYSCLAVIGDKYGWDVSGATFENGSFTTLGNDLNTAWHTAYNANPTEFSELQNAWAYKNYYDGSTGARRSLMAMGIDIDSRSDYVKGLCWGMCNLFGGGGGYSYIEDGYYYGWNWFLKNSGVDNSMDDQTFVTTLCNFVINNVSTRYPSQSKYWEGWEKRYSSELTTCLSYGYNAADSFASSASDSTLAPGIYEIAASTNTKQVLDIPGASLDEGTTLELFSSNDTDAQAWTIFVGNDGYCTIINKKSGLVLDVVGGAACRGTAVDQWSSNDTRAQKWAAVQNSDGTVTFHSALGKDLVLDIPTGNTSNGNRLQIWSSNGSSAQKFICNNLVLRKASDNINGSVLPSGIYTVTSANSSSAVLDVTGGQTNDGANIQLWGSNSTGAQKWQVTIDAEGFVTLVNLRSGKALDVTAGIARSGANVQQWTSNNTSAQKWVVIKNSDGSLTLWSKLGSNLVLDIAGGSTSNGSNVQIYAYNGSGAQRFYFNKTSGGNNSSTNNMRNATLSEGTYVLSSLVGNNQVLDVPGGSLSRLTKMQTYSNNQTPAQRWYVRQASTGYTLQNVESGLYLTDSNGAAIQTDNNMGQTSQWLVMNANGSSTSAFLVNAQTGKVLDVSGGQSVSGTHVGTYAFNGTTAQKWSLSTESLLSVGTYEFASDVDNNMRLDVDGGSHANGGNVQIFSNNDTHAQKWRISSSPSSFYTITNLGSGKLLDVAGGSSASGTNVWQYSSNQSAAQKWKFIMSSKGLKIISSLGTALDVAGGGTANGTNVWAYSPNETSAQTWHPISTSG